MEERVRLLIWDLDETFWHGTLTEGGITIRHDTLEIVRELARRGIVSSICSKNNFDEVRGVLEREGIWDYFIFPSINWEPKGPRVANLIDTVQLRPSTVMFIDDNTLNLSEAQHITPGLQVRPHEFIPEILRSPLFIGKTDDGLTRLNQYKLLEQRKGDEKQAGSDIRGFLRSSNIRVYVEHNLEQHLDRAVELINRTNQLNYTKLRLPEDTNQAKIDLLRLLSSHEVQAGILRVRDRYGDHGWCGLYILHNNGRLLQYAFSCRVLGMGVETWLYNRLGRPKIDVVGEVLIDLKSAQSDVDWIEVENDKQHLDAAVMTNTLASRIISRGGCDLMAVSHYFGLLTPVVVGEFNENRIGLDGRIDHSMFLYYALAGAPAEGIEAAKNLGYIEKDFMSSIATQQGEADVWLLSFWTDAAYTLYRHRSSGLVLPFAFPGYNQSDARSADYSKLLSDPAKKLMSQALDALKQEWEYAGYITELEYKRNLSAILSHARSSTKVFILGANEYWVNVDGFGEILSRTRNLNKWTREVVGTFHNVVFVNVRDFVNSESEVHTQFHFDRMVYVRIFEFVEATLRQGRPPADYASWAVHEEKDLLLPQEPKRSFAACARSAAFLLNDNRHAEAAELASQAIELEPDSIPTKLLLAEAHNKSGQHQAAVTIARGVFADLATENLSTGVLRRLADLFFEIGHYSYSEDLYRQLTKREPSNLVHRHRLANSIVQQGDKNGAYLIFRTCLDDGDTNPHVQAHAGRLLFELGRWEELEELLVSSLRLNPGFPGLLELEKKLRS